MEEFFGVIFRLIMLYASTPLKPSQKTPPRKSAPQNSSKQTANFFSTAQGQTKSADPTFTDRFWIVSWDVLKLDTYFSGKMGVTLLQAAQRALVPVLLTLVAQCGLDVNLSRESQDKLIQTTFH